MMATAAGGTHPTGMHFVGCTFEFFRIEFYRICKICRKLFLVSKMKITKNGFLQIL